MRGIQDRPGLEPRACLKIEGKAHDLSGQAGTSDVRYSPPFAPPVASLPEWPTGKRHDQRGEAPRTEYERARRHASHGRGAQYRRIQEHF